MPVVSESYVNGAAMLVRAENKQQMNKQWNKEQIEIQLEIYQEKIIIQ